MPRKHDDISMAYRIDKLPKPIPKREVYETLIEAARSGGVLPPGWKVTWIWRNTAKQAPREASFQRAVSKSRVGFTELMVRRLSRDAGIIPPPVREARPAEEEAFDEALTEAEERRAVLNVKQKAAAKRKARAEFLRRSAAAKKGWETRRLREKARKRGKKR